MNTSVLLSGIRHTKEYKELWGRLGELRKDKKPLPLVCYGVSEGAEYSLIYSLINDLREEKSGTLLVIVGEERKANKLNEFFKKSGLKSEFYPVRDFNFYDMTASRELEYERLKVLYGVASSYLDVVISTPEALMQYTMPKEKLLERTFSVSVSDTIDIEALVRKLNDTGYSPSELVESAGQYAVRGGICDIFPTKGEFKINGKEQKEQMPVRIELFGDEVERLEIFDPISQRMCEKIESFAVTPSKEIIPSEEQVEKIKEILEGLKSSAISEENKKELEKEIFSVNHFSSVSFYDRFISLIYPEKQCLLNYFDNNSIAIMCDYAVSERKAKECEKISGENAKTLIENHLISPEYAFYGTTYAKFEEFKENHQMIDIDEFMLSRVSEQGGIYNFKSKRIAPANHYLNTIVEELKSLTEDGYKCVLVCQTETEVKGTMKTLGEYEVSAFPIGNGDFDTLKNGCVGLICDTYPDGYEFTGSKFALMVLSSKSGIETKKQIRNKKFAKNAGEQILSCSDINAGDYIVHANYGIGKYLGIENLQVCGAYRDYIAIQYAGTDKLYLPVDQLDLVAKYIGSKSSDGEVRLSKMGGLDWKKSTQRAKTAAKDMAKELIELYARRTRLNGFAFLPDGLMEREFDSSFEFEETDCQLEAIKDIKSDMEKPYPMDRVLCGDVGYGKTEVAFRAAMKAVANGKQVAILVPTTILAMQHYQTALTRFAGTGVNIDMISRFRTTKEQNTTKRKLRRGDIDIIIGTHKLLGGTIEFKDLGLLIVDEEQRFGVAQKEKIKKAVPDVDVLTLSATPIPRTLSMAMGGIRDMSLLDEAPTGRVGVQSYVLEYDESIINDAIKRELHRGGQVFYLYNNVEHIYTIAQRIRASFPDARIQVAHGQMAREEIEDIWQELVKGEVDILVSTTIIETGIDIPNANTLIIENADKMGLAQLHQIRGRVGRSHRRAYAYFTYRKGKEISEIAAKRLGAIRDFAEFGAGFKIAMRDLEIRGAGNLLGAAQHGHLDSVGYDMYVRLLNEAVLEEKGEVLPERFETLLTVSRDAFIPKSYIKSSLIRMEIYKKISHIQNEDDFNDIVNELRDRFGKIPKSVETLCEIAIIKSYAQTAKIKKVEQMREEVRLYPSEINLPALAEISKIDRKKINVCGVGRVPYISLKIDPVLPFYEETVSLIKKYIEKCEKI